MSNSDHFRTWWTARELAGSGLPDVPATRQGVEALAGRLDWRADPSLARRRAARGGGWEYNWRLLPVRAQTALLKGSRPEADTAVTMERGDAWQWFDGLPDRVKAKARERLEVIQKVEALEAPMGKNLAVETVAAQCGVSARSIWNWLGMIEGQDVSDRLAYLAPRHRAASPKRERAVCSQEFLDRMRADYLRLAGPSLRSVHRRVVNWCQQHDLAYLEYRTTLRWFDENVPRVVLVHAREGERGLARCFPPQIRDRSTLAAMEGVVADCHKLDVFVQWPEIEKPVRVQIVAFTDLYSNKVLSWKIDLDPNKVAVASALGELVETWGIPKHCLFDNGREFANKWLTGGVPTRFRFKVRDDDVLGILPQMGIKVHWATPGHGQAKPIERSFRDFADDIARHPAFSGAYVGNRPDAKPEDYGSRAIPLADLLDVVDLCVKEHNARQGRLTPTAKGRSFDDTFAESYARGQVRKATAEQHRLWLMGQEERKLHKHHGAFQLFENSYWADWMNEHVGEEVVARFDPENLHAGLFIYARSGEFMGFAECREKVGFFDLVGAKNAARLKRQQRAAVKKVLDMHRPVSVDQWAEELKEAQRAEAPLVEAKVVELDARHRRKPLLERPLPVPDTSDEERLNVFNAPFNRSQPEPAKPEHDPVAQFWRALDIERRSEAGEPVSEEDAAFWARMQRLPEYRARRLMFERHGAEAIL
ncbi:Mu transposase C-terminal domain-containing protein [Rhodobacter sp. NTK016B]|uniref:transposase domain-containing protein n=1 Tax=Rhodobacter sp. NTK016B TaxID=2759676 RepID=UPI001A8D680C|nr:transposase domain-containing protein [Rhodobacter sp. NTK016B]MBN8294706.1 Mu transposase C-terminal domain-containing protein [Rhodobacter sp. NTK016B]